MANNTSTPVVEITQGRAEIQLPNGRVFELSLRQAKLLRAELDQKIGTYERAAYRRAVVELQA